MQGSVPEVHKGEFIFPFKVGALLLNASVFAVSIDY